MARIQQLSPHVADLIAAGEVVERPASVVKELVENALDAGAERITVEIEGGGMALIRVTDDGCGIGADQLPTAFLRHATSKLRSASDLASIATLGFRGEALAAISAVSRMDVFSREREAAEGARLSLEGGIPGQVLPAGCPEGTTMVVRQLFYNTPARLKFMKKDSAEAGAVSAVVQQLALSNPQISFRFLKDGEEVLNTPGDGRLSSAVYAVLGRDFAQGLVPVSGSGEEVEVSGFVTRPVCGRGTRSMQIFFVNGRLVKTPLLTAALEEAYKNQLLKGRFPGCVLHLTLPAAQVDVNVHPAKTVVKFARERTVFSAVHHVVRDALAAGDSPGIRPAPAQPAVKAAPRPDFYQTMDAAAFRQRQEKPFVTAVPPVRSELGGKVTVSDAVRPCGPVRRPVSLVPDDREEAEMDGGPEKESPLSTKPSTPVEDSAPESRETRREAALSRELSPEAAPPVENPPAREEQLTLTPDPPRRWRLAGEALRTYILAEDGESLWLIDKHAAHERVIFDRLKAQGRSEVSQRLLAPEAVKLAPEDAAALLEQLPLLRDFGFEAEEFGEATLLVRAIPGEIDPGQIRETLELLAQQLRTAGTADPEGARDALLHTVACKAAIKGGWVSEAEELRVLMEQVERGAVRYCPHGRPVAVELTRRELEKMFKRA